MEREEENDGEIEKDGELERDGERERERVKGGRGRGRG